MAQEGEIPPVVASEGPMSGDGGAMTEALPLLPGIAVPPVLASAADATASSSAETDLLGLILKAHPVVQTVMGLLALAIAAVLTVFLFKVVEFRLAFARLRKARVAMAAGTGLLLLPGSCPLAEAAQTAVDEIATVSKLLTADLRASSQSRLDLALDRIEARAVMQLRSGTGLLASIGAVGPFVGLFGTVFGIMNSFLAIAATKTTSLAVVAPGIAEALLATGIGLVAAIPAVLLYNAVIRRIAAYRHGLADGRAELVTRFSRELDRRMAAGA